MVAFATKIPQISNPDFALTRWKPQPKRLALYFDWTALSRAGVVEVTQCTTCLGFVPERSLLHNDTVASNWHATFGFN